MDYKKIVKSRSLRHKILKLLSFIPDKTMLSLQYRLKLKRKLNLKNPERYTEKIQLYKMFYRNPILPELVDKLEVRRFIEKKGLKDTLPQLLGVFRKAEDIDFAPLPNKFVIKTNDGSGGNNIVICRDKTALNIDETVKKVNSWLDVKSVNAGREWAYTGIKDSLIIVEEFLENEKNPEGGLEDFKFLCFDGKPYCVVHDGDRYTGHKRNIYDLNWQNLNIGSDCDNFPCDAPKPGNLKEMVDVAAKLSEGFPFVRVDLYSVKGKIYFGELTFYPWSGYVKFDPDEFDYRLGKEFDLTLLDANQ